MNIGITDKWNVGRLSFVFSTVIDGKEIPYEYEAESLTETEALYVYRNKNFHDEIRLSFSECLTASRTITNVSGKSLPVNELKTVIKGISFGGESKKDYFYHNENPRIFESFTFPIDYKRTKNDAKNSEFDVVANNKWADPGVVSERIGASPYQPFPAILLSNYEKTTGLVHGTLSQKVFYHSYLAEHGDGVELTVFSAFKDTSVRVLSPNRSLTDAWYLGITAEADDIEKIFSGYTAELRKVLVNTEGRKNINRDNMIWGSWNDGILRNVSEQLVEEEASAVKKYFPTVKWIQIDDGYSTCKDVAHGLGVAYEGSDGIDKDKFPNGLSYIANKIKSIGLHPSLWIGGFCPVETKIYKEHPEWFLDYAYRIESYQPLDISQKAVRDYMAYALDELVVKNGFEGVKLDFWSYAFEDSHDLYKEKDKSGYEYRDWWTNEIRRRLPEYGYLQTGCDIVMGNPFLSQRFTNYRYGIDMSEGNWDNIQTILLWGSACFALHTGDLFVANSDGIGVYKDLPFDVFMYWINYVIITRSGVELAGRYSKKENVLNDRFEIVRKAACNPNNGQDVYFAKFNYRKPGKVVPEIFYIETPHFSNLKGEEGFPLRTVAVLNSKEGDNPISFTVEDLNLPKGEYVFYDVWSGERFVGDGFSDVFRARGSRMFAVCPTEGINLFDCNFRVKNIKLTGNIVTMENDNIVDYATMAFSRDPDAILLDGEKIEFTEEKGIVRCRLNAVGKLKIVFGE